MSGPKPVKMTRRLTVEEYRIAQERGITDIELLQNGFEPPTQAPKAPRQLTPAEAEIAKREGVSAEELKAAGFTLPNTARDKALEGVRTSGDVRPGDPDFGEMTVSPFAAPVLADAATLGFASKLSPLVRKARARTADAVGEKFANVMEGGASLAIPMTMGPKILKEAPLALKMLGYGGKGAITGALVGVGHDRSGQPVEAAKRGAKWGGTIGAALPLGGALAGGIAREAGITTAAGRAAKAQQAIDRAVYRAGGDPVNVQSGLGKGKTLVEAMGPAGDEILKGVQGLGDKSAREASIASQGMGEVGKKVFDAAQRAPEKSWAENLMSHLGPVGRGTYKVATGGARRSSRKEAETLMSALTKRQSLPADAISVPSGFTAPTGMSSKAAAESMRPWAQSMKPSAEIPPSMVQGMAEDLVKPDLAKITKRLEGLPKDQAQAAINEYPKNLQSQLLAHMQTIARKQKGATKAQLAARKPKGIPDQPVNVASAQREVDEAKKAVDSFFARHSSPGGNRWGEGDRAFDAQNSEERQRLVRALQKAESRLRKIMTTKGPP